MINTTRLAGLYYTWLAGSGVAGLSGLDGMSGQADRERHAYMDKKCDAYLFSSPRIIPDHMVG